MYSLTNDIFKYQVRLKKINKMQDNTNIKGGLFIALGMLLLAIADNYIRFVTETIGLWQFHLSRSLIAIPILIFAVMLQGGRIFPQHFKLVFLRTLLMVFAMLIYFGCLAFFPISQVAAGLFTSPIFVIIFSILLLRENVYISRVFAVLIGSLGTFLALSLNFYDFSILSLFPITAGVFYALASITTRLWCREEDARSLMFMFFFGIGFVSFIMIFLIELNQIFQLYSLPNTFITSPLQTYSLNDLAIIFMHALLSVIGGILITLGYQKGITSFVAVFEYSFLFFVTFWAYLLFSDQISMSMLLGMSLIILSGLVISNSKDRNKMH